MQSEEFGAKPGSIERKQPVSHISARRRHNKLGHLGVILSKDFAELRGAAINSIQAAELIRTFGIKVEF